jgi:hypothetical protein
LIDCDLRQGFSTSNKSLLSQLIFNSLKKDAITRVHVVSKRLLLSSKLSLNIKPKHLQHKNLQPPALHLKTSPHLPSLTIPSTGRFQFTLCLIVLHKPSSYPPILVALQKVNSKKSYWRWLIFSFVVLVMILTWLIRINSANSRVERSLCIVKSAKRDQVKFVIMKVFVLVATLIGVSSTLPTYGGGGGGGGFG